MEAAKKFAGVGVLGSLAILFATSTLFSGAIAPEAKANCFGGGGYADSNAGGFDGGCGGYGGFDGGGMYNPPGPGGDLAEFGGGDFAGGGCSCGGGFGPGPGPMPGPYMGGGFMGGPMDQTPFYNEGGMPGPM